MCSCDMQIEHKSLTLGEVLDGDRMALSQYELKFKGEFLKCCVHLFMQPPMKRMRICFTDVFFCFFLFFPSVTKIPDNRSRERLNGFS